MEKQGGIYARYSPGRDRDQTSTIEAQVAWKSSDMPAHYAKAELAERDAIARFRYGKGR